MGKSQRERILYFDLIKLIAMLCVFVCHFTRSLEAAGVGFVLKYCRIPSSPCILEALE